ncbi:hypothetical protein MMC25_000152 [Agyrium rufum]|nr:hypothetical protein [Agyrium rufum]
MSLNLMASKALMAVYLSEAVTTVPTSNSKVTRDVANITTFGNGDNPPCLNEFTPFEYVDCYVDPSIPRALTFTPPGLDGDEMTPELCTAACKANGYRYAGLEYFYQCFCGMQITTDVAARGDCNTPCNGDAGKTCGGSDRLSVYVDPTFPLVTDGDVSDYQSVGCYSEALSGRALSVTQTQLSYDDMTVDLCLETCRSQGFPLAGVEFYGECYCDVNLGLGSEAADPENCQYECNGGNGNTCGGSGYLNLYVAEDLMEPEPCSANPSFPVFTQTITSSLVSVSTTSSATSTQSTTSATTLATTTASPSSTSSKSSSNSSSSSSSSLSMSKSTSTSTSSTSTSSKSLISAPTLTSTKPTSTWTSSTLVTMISSSSTSKGAPPPHGNTNTPTSTVSSSTSTTSSSEKCTVTVAPPVCEYSANKWCSTPLPSFHNQATCQKALASCVIQIFDCFAHNPSPSSAKCYQFRSFCQGIGQYCGDNCKDSSDSCSKEDCFKKELTKPKGPTAPSHGPCATVTYTSPSQTTGVHPPTATNVCKKPQGPSGSGFEGSTHVGNLSPPICTCNDDRNDFQRNPFKLYSSQNRAQCPSYPRRNVPSACQQACSSQYENCVKAYAEGCRDQKKSAHQDDYESAKKKCDMQKAQCLDVNKKVGPSDQRCASYNVGWS